MTGEEYRFPGQFESAFMHAVLDLSQTADRLAVVDDINKGIAEGRYTVESFEGFRKLYGGMSDNLLKATIISTYRTGKKSGEVGIQELYCLLEEAKRRKLMD